MSIKVVEYTAGRSRALRVRGREMMFVKGQPRAVPTPIAEHLIKTGRFRLVPPLPDADFDLDVQYTGSYGDAVCYSHVLQHMAEEDPLLRIAGRVRDPYLDVCRRIAPSVRIYPFDTQLVSSSRLLLDYTRRPRGEGAAWFTHIAHMFGLPYFPPPRKIQFSEEESLIKPLIDFPAYGGFIVVHAYSHHARSKSYDPGRLESLTHELFLRTGRPVVVVGYRNEPGKVSKLAVDLRGRLSFVESAAVVSKAKVALTVDSWGQHMARICGIPQLVLFGSTALDHPEYQQSWDKSVMVRGEICSGKLYCSKFSCEKSSCIDRLSQEHVLDMFCALMVREGLL